MKYKAYWMHVSGEVLPVETIHIAEVIKYPEKFGYTYHQIEAVYKEFNEPMGHEGKAREKIMADIILNHHWIRLRYSPARDTWVVQLDTLTEPLKKQIIEFLKQPDVCGGNHHSDFDFRELCFDKS